MGHFNALGHLAKGRVLAVQIGALSTMMKNWLPAELGRWERAMEMHAGGVLQVVFESHWHGKLALNAVAGAAHAGALRVAALNHKAGDHPVEDSAVIESPCFTR